MTWKKHPEFGNDIEVSTDGRVRYTKDMLDYLSGSAKKHLINGRELPVKVNAAGVRYVGFHVRQRIGYKRKDIVLTKLMMATFGEPHAHKRYIGFKKVEPGVDPYYFDNLVWMASAKEVSESKEHSYETPNSEPRRA